MSGSGIRNDWVRLQLARLVPGSHGQSVSVGWISVPDIMRRPQLVRGLAQHLLGHLLPPFFCFLCRSAVSLAAAAITSITGAVVAPTLASTSFIWELEAYHTVFN